VYLVVLVDVNVCTFSRYFDAFKCNNVI